MRAVEQAELLPNAAASPLAETASRMAAPDSYRTVDQSAPESTRYGATYPSRTDERCTPVLRAYLEGEPAK